MIQGDQLVIYTSLAASYTIPSLRLSFGAKRREPRLPERTPGARAPDAATTRSPKRAHQPRRLEAVGELLARYAVGNHRQAALPRCVVSSSARSLRRHEAAAATSDSWLRTDKPGSEEVELQQKLPDIIRWALRFRQDKYELRLFGDITRWSMFERQCVVDKGTKCRAES